MFRRSQRVGAGSGAPELRRSRAAAPLEESAEGAFIGHAAAFCDLSDRKGGASQEGFRRESPPVPDRLTGGAAEMVFEQFHQCGAVQPELVRQKIDVQIRIRQIVPDQIQCVPDRIVIAFPLPPASARSRQRRAGIERKVTGEGSPILR